MDYGQQAINACAADYAARLDAADAAAEAAADTEMAIWRLLAQSPDDAAEWVDANGTEFCHAENAFGRLAHFVGFMRAHGPFDADALAVIGARVVAEMEAIVNPAANREGDLL